VIFQVPETVVEVFVDTLPDAVFLTRVDFEEIGAPEDMAEFGSDDTWIFILFKSANTSL
jgi:hypothetical protein